MYVPERTRADLRFYTALYLGMLLGAVTKSLRNAPKPDPAPAEETTNVAVVPE
jgi:hypothetical protein